MSLKLLPAKCLKVTQANFGSTVNTWSTTCVYTERMKSTFYLKCCLRNINWNWHVHGRGVSSTVSKSDSANLSKRPISIYENSAWQRCLEDTNKGNWMTMFIHFFCLCPLGLTIKLNFKISKVAYSLLCFPVASEKLMLCIHWTAYM